MFISSCGATVSAVIGALAIGDGNNYLAVVFGGFTILLIYSIFSIAIKICGIESINKIFPPIIVGPVTMVIGLNLATFIPTYVSVEGQHNDIGIIVGIITMLIIALSSTYFKGFWKTIPFLIGLIGGYIISAIITLCGGPQLIDFNIFKDVAFFNLPDFSFTHWSFDNFSWGTVCQSMILFLPVGICALL